MDYKEIYCEIIEQLEEDLGRFPDLEEIREAWASYCSQIIDSYS